MLQNISAQLPAQTQKIGIFDEQRLHWGSLVRSLMHHKEFLGWGKVAIQILKRRFCFYNSKNIFFQGVYVNITDWGIYKIVPNKSMNPSGQVDLSGREEVYSLMGYSVFSSKASIQKMPILL